MENNKQIIYKYFFEPNEWRERANGGREVSCSVPVGYEILKIRRSENGIVDVWAKINPYETKKTYMTLVEYMTGEEGEINGEYIDTLFVNSYNGIPLVFHFFKE